MAFNGSGVFNRLHNWVTDRDGGVKIMATKMDQEMDGFATGLSNCLLKDGQQAATANQPMGGFLHSNIGNGTARNHYAAIGQVQDSAIIWGGTAGGTANTLTLTATPSLSAYTAGQHFIFLPATTNTAASTINIDSLGGQNIFVLNSQLTGGELLAGVPACIVYDGTQFQLISGSRRPPTISRFTSSGTWNKPTGLSVAIVFAQGAGGGGGGVSAVSGNTGGGGGAGQYGVKRILAADIGTTETVTIGAGGSPGTIAGSNGGNGGNTSFGSHITMNGGNGGNGSTSGAATGGAGGTGGSGSDFAVNGTPGMGGRTGISWGGPGASSFFGGGGRESYGMAGGAGNIGGGGGAGASSTGSANPGGEGGAGYLEVMEFY